MLKNQALSATFWSAADILLRQGLQLGVSIFLARILSPEEFGTIALLYLFAGIASVFVDSGFSAALIQRQDVAHIDESTAFWCNLALGALIGAGLWMSAPAIAGLFALPVLVPLTGVLALNVFFSALGSIHGALLTKRLDFRTQMKISAFSTVLSGGVAILMAWYGYGVWALAMQTLAATVVTTGLLWYYNQWRPTFEFDRASARKSFGFGGYFMAASLLDIVYSRLFTLLIGKFHGVRELGFYNRADSTKQLPTGVLMGIMSRVAFPLFSTTAQDKPRLRRGVQMAVRGTMLLNVPMMLGLAILAEPVVLTLFGAKWLPSVPLLQVLCLSGVLWPLHVININVLIAQGHADLCFRLQIIKTLLGLALVAGGAYWGAIGIAWSQLVFSVIAFGINAFYSKRFLDYGIVAQTRDFLPVLAVAVSMALAVHWVSTLLWLPPLLQVIVLVALGMLIFISLGSVFRLIALHDAVNLIRRRKLSAYPS